MIKFKHLKESIQKANDFPEDVSHHEFRKEVTPKQREHYAGVYEDFINNEDRKEGAFVHASVMPKNLKEHLTKYGSASLIGQEAPTTHDLAVLAQIHRDPRVESLHMIYTKGNKIVGHNTVSSRMPASVSPFKWNTNPTNDFIHMQEDMKHFGADGYYMLHNHPSGHSTPSSADVRITKAFAESVPGFKSHIVIDNSEYHTIDEKGNTEHVKLDHPIHYDLSNPEHHLKHHEVVGMPVTGAYDAAQVGKHFENPNHVTLIGVRGPKLEVSSVVSMPQHLLEGADENTLNRIRHFSRHTGSSRNFIVVPTDHDLKKFEHHISLGTATDVVSRQSGNGVRQHMMGHPHESTYGVHDKDIQRYGSLTNPRD